MQAMNTTRNIITFLLLMLLALPAWCRQQVKVLRETHNPNETTARVYAASRSDRGLDRNNNPCALVVIEGEELENYLFDAGNIHCKAEMRTLESGERAVFILISEGAKRLSIKHKNREIDPLNYTFENGPLTASDTYHVVMDRVAQGMVGGKQYLKFEVEPRTASLWVKEKQADVPWDLDAEGKASKLMEAGNYQYSVSGGEDYYPSYGMASLDANSPTTEKVRLRPTFGYLSLPQDKTLEDASVYIDQQRQSKLSKIKLKGGKHSLQIKKKLYKMYSREIYLREGADTTIKVQLEYNATPVQFNCDVPTAGIYLLDGNDRRYLGKAGCSTDFEPGSYTIMAMATGHRDGTARTIEVTEGMSTAGFLIPSPVPQYGSLDVNSTPGGATIFLDNKQYETTPQVINGLLAGKHSLRLSREGYREYTINLTIEPDSVTSVNAALSRSYTEQKTQPQAQSTPYRNYGTVDPFPYGKTRAAVKAINEAVGDETFLHPYVGVAGLSIGTSFKWLSYKYIAGLNLGNINIEAGYTPIIDRAYYKIISLKSIDGKLIPNETRVDRALELRMEVDNLNKKWGFPIIGGCRMLETEDYDWSSSPISKYPLMCFGGIGLRYNLVKHMALYGNAMLSGYLTKTPLVLNGATNVELELGIKIIL